jgi:PncC family amidohydrolase
MTLATAESLTGGMIGAALTAIPGSSDAYWGGVVSYSVNAKARLLFVTDATIARYGVVSEETAKEMAAGALSASGANVAISVTGIAGPSGGSADKPVGTVCIACCVAGGQARAVTARFRGSRDAVRRRTVRAALAMALDSLDRI